MSQCVNKLFTSYLIPCRSLFFLISSLTMEEKIAACINPWPMNLNLKQCGHCAVKTDLMFFNLPVKNFTM